MSAPTSLGAVLRNPFASLWLPFARRAWCRKQRTLLRAPGHAVIWVRGALVAWAHWGASRDYFEVQQMDGLSYLRAAGAPAA
jgi:hypothetical protein